MRVLTILGTRPEIIRLSLIIPLLDSLCDHTVVFTGQNFSPELSTVFFNELGVRAPDYNLEARGDFAEQLATIAVHLIEIIRSKTPDKFLVLGDTNSSLGGIIAKRAGIPVYHMEAGNRCFDDAVPEEVNRRLIDHASDILLPYTQQSRENLIREGIASDRVFVTGNPIGEVIDYYRSGISASTILDRLRLEARKYVLVTLHRTENVDNPARLMEFCQAFSQLTDHLQIPLIVSTHPRTRKRIGELGLTVSDEGQVRFLEPFSFFDFVHLEQHALLVCTDSGTVQEECSLLGVPTVTLRDTTERPETISCGSNILSGCQTEAILRAAQVMLRRPRTWQPPPEYLTPGVSSTVAQIVLGYHNDARVERLWL